MQSILFVCLGNICRSPLAEGVAREIIKQNNLAIEVDSAGTSGWHIDEPPCEGSRAVARQHGFSIDDLRGRRLSVYADDRFDLIIALDCKAESAQARGLWIKWCRCARSLHISGYGGL